MANFQKNTVHLQSFTHVLEVSNKELWLIARRVDEGQHGALRNLILHSREREQISARNRGPSDHPNCSCAMTIARIAASVNIIVTTVNMPGTDEVTHVLTA